MAFARLEYRQGKVEEARKVLDRALLLVPQLPPEMAADAILLCRSYVEEEVARGNEGRARRVLIHHALGPEAAGLEDGAEPAPVAVVKTRRRYQVGPVSLLPPAQCWCACTPLPGAWGAVDLDTRKRRGVFLVPISPPARPLTGSLARSQALLEETERGGHAESAAMHFVDTVACRAWTERLFSGLQEAIQVYEACLASNEVGTRGRCARRRLPPHCPCLLFPQLDEVVEEQVRLDMVALIATSAAQGATPPRLLRSALIEALERFPNNPDFLTLFIVGEARYAGVIWILL